MRGTMDRSKTARAKRRVEAEYRNAIVGYQRSHLDGEWRPMNRARASWLETRLNNGGYSRPDYVTDEMINELIEWLKGF